MKPILFADDSKVIRESISPLLEKYSGIAPVMVTDGASLVERARAGGYSIIITDKDMPKLTGLEAIAEIRKFDQKTPIYLISVMMRSSIKRKAIFSGAEGAFVKNDVKELERVIKHYRSSEQE